MAEHCAPTQSLRRSHQEATKWYRWLLMLAASWPDNAQTRLPKRDSHGGRVQTRAASVPATSGPLPLSVADLVLHPGSPHCLKVNGGDLRCTSCPRKVTAGGSGIIAKIVAASACIGDIPSRAMGGDFCWPDGGGSERLASTRRQPPGVRGRGRDLFLSGSLTRFRLCGAYSVERLSGLKLQYSGPSLARASKLARLAGSRSPPSVQRGLGSNQVPA